MANYLASLPAYKPGPGINLEPVNNALDSIIQQNDRNRQFGMQQQQIDAQNAERTYQHGRDAKQDRLQEVQLYGKQATAVDQMQGPQRAAAWNSILARHGTTGLTPEELDPVTGPKLMAAQAGQYLDPRDSKLKDLQLQNVQSEIEARNRPQFTTVGRDSYGQPTYGFVDPRARTVTPAPGSQPTTGEVEAPGQGLTGEAYLKTIPKPQADQIKAIAEGRLPIPGGFALKTPYWQQMLTHVSQYDPSFDSVNYNARAKTRNDFTSGKSAQNITSFNTAIGHLGELNHAIDALDNSDFTLANKATNATASVNADRAAKLSTLKTAVNAVADELSRAFKGAAGTLQEIDEWKKVFDQDASKPAQKAALKTAVNLLASRIDAIGEQYNKGMGTTSDPVTLLNPKAQKLWKSLNGGEAPEQPQASGAPRTTIPQVGEVRDGFRFKGGNPGDRNSWEAAQ